MLNYLGLELVFSLSFKVFKHQIQQTFNEVFYGLCHDAFIGEG
jgi:hypothetical protein